MIPPKPPSSFFLKPSRVKNRYNIDLKREGFSMFEAMYDSINQEVAETIFRVQPIRDQTRPRGVFSSLPQKLVHNEFSSLSGPGAALPPPSGSMMPPPPAPEGERPAARQPIQKEGPKVGRNDPCPCGSGKKYKKCHGQ